ncbi:hypothetical protein ACVRZR_08835 [Streptococcus entericus]|uniref:hypothetical protein n=1 Tax=Streptococcus entericus TaxID=155680 RepID=UPI000381AEC2|nr:hypothetical protein [Streptococcus entericus]
MRKNDYHYLPDVIGSVITYWLSEIYYLLMIVGFAPYDYLVLKGLAVSNLLVFTPIIIIIVSFHYGVKNGISLTLPILLAVAYLPSLDFTGSVTDRVAKIKKVFLYVLYIYSVTHSTGIEIYLLIYGVLSLMAVATGEWLRLILKKMRQKS